MKKFLIVVVVLFVILSAVAPIMVSSFFVDAFIKSKVSFYVSDGSIEEAVELSNEELEKIASSIPMKEKINITNIVIRNLKMEDIKKLAKIASDPSKDTEDIIEAAKEFMNMFEPEDLAKIKEIYEKYVKPASVNP